ncbi:hypothetical protein M501DRAFT_651512 [Patellaria atrata CBS 101060]|uniref:Uncharacterized protein n=1 Tax=Patellaria atrata CBS 101060 TaxID=1346257 RepID=A0A9P4SFZ6_9PEZI|nr:hypothetical protein M501DRAFT_651512 [Patellaria atrata CBS 101060]
MIYIPRPKLGERGKKGEDLANNDVLHRGVLDQRATNRPPPPFPSKLSRSLHRCMASAGPLWEEPKLDRLPDAVWRPRHTCTCSLVLAWFVLFVGGVWWREDKLDAATPLPRSLHRAKRIRGG